MNTALSDLDRDTYKAQQRRQWGATATGWGKWGPMLEQAYGQRLSEGLVRLAGIQPGQRVLDIATGYGEPALTAARRVGPAGQVVATDLSPEMLVVAHERARAQGVTNVRFVEADAERLDYPDGTFDAALCRCGLMFVPDLPGALRRIRLMLVPGGVFAAAVWDTPPKGSPSALAFGLAREMFELPNPTPAKGAPQDSLAGNALDRALTEAGFRDVKREIVPADMVWPSTDVCLDFIREMFPGVSGPVSQATPERQADFWQRWREAVQVFATPEGSLSVPSAAICVVGRH
ncbi:MAG: methyltransferase domain-containing protein [Anaerolineales bacterium]|nr:methyltransferase domain-containing protein [Anaerolineales bacterium]